MIWGLLFALVGLAAGAHLGRNQLVARALPGLLARLQGRLGESLRLEGGAVTLDHRYDLRVADLVVAADPGRLELTHASFSGVAGAALSRGARPPRLEAATARLHAADFPPILLEFAGVAPAEPGLLLAGTLTTSEGWVPRAPGPALRFTGDLTVTEAGETRLVGVLETGPTRLEVELAADASGAPGPGKVQGAVDLEDLGPWLPPDVQPRGTATVAYSWAGPDQGSGELAVPDLLVPSFAALAAGAEAAGFPRLPANIPGTVQVRLSHDEDGFHAEGLDLVAEPLKVSGEARLGAELAGTLELSVDNRYLSAGPGPLADLDPQQRTRATATLHGTRDAPGGTLALAEPFALPIGAGEVQLTALEGAYDSGDAAPRLGRAEGLARAPGPRGGTWMVPLRFRGRVDPAGPLAGDLVIEEAFLQVPAAPPPLPPARFDGTVRLLATGDLEVDGTASAGGSSLEVTVRRDPGGFLTGTRAHGQVDPALVQGMLPDDLTLGLPEGAALMGEATVDGPEADPVARLELFAPELAPGSSRAVQLPLRQATLKLEVDRRRARLEAFEAQTLGGKLRVHGDVDLGASLASVLTVELDGLRVEQIPTGPGGAREVAAHLKAGLCGTLTVSPSEAGWEAEGPVTFVGGELLFLRPLSREAEAAGYPPLGVRAEGDAPARASFRDGVLRFDDLLVSAAPLAAEGWLEFGGEAGFAGDLALEVGAQWLRVDDAPVVPVEEEETVHTQLVFGAGGTWGLALREPCRIHGDDFAAKLTATRVVGLPGEGTQLAVEELAGTAWIEDVAGGRLHLPFHFTGDDQPKTKRWLAGELVVEGGRLRGAGLDIPPIDGKGTLIAKASGAAELRGKLRTAGSRLKLELTRAADGDLEGTRVVGTLAFAEFTDLLPPDLRVATPDAATLRVEATTHGTPPDWTSELELSTEVLAISGPDLPDLELGEPYLTARLRPHELRIRRFEADLLGGEAEVAGKVTFTDPPEVDLEIQLRKLVAEDIPTDPDGGRALADLVAGRLSGQLSLTGSPSDPYSLEGSGKMNLNEARWLFLRDVPDTARLGPLPVVGRGPGTAELALARGVLQVERFQGRVDGLRFRGDVEIDIDGPLSGLFHAHLEPDLMSKSPLLAIPAATLGELVVPIRLGGSWRNPQVDVQVAEVLEGMVGKSRIGSTLKGAVDTMWSTFGTEGVSSSADTDELIGRILEGGPDADRCIEALIDAGLDEDDIQELVQDYGRRRRR